jgi:hypothetical protein
MHLHMSNNLQDLKYLQTGSFNPVGVCEIIRALQINLIRLLHMSNNLQDLKYLQTGSLNPVKLCEIRIKTQRLPIICQAYMMHLRTMRDMEGQRKTKRLKTNGLYLGTRRSRQAE